MYNCNFAATFKNTFIQFMKREREKKQTVGACQICIALISLDNRHSDN